MEWLRSLFAPFFNERGMATMAVQDKAHVDAGVPEWWAPTVEYEARMKSVTSKLAGGDGSGASIIENRDLNGRKGDQITFTRFKRVLGEGASGTGALMGNEEAPTIGTYTVPIELYRHALAWDEIVDQEAVGNWNAIARNLLADWLQRRLDDDVMEQLLVTDTAVTIYGGSKASRSTLGPDDRLIPRELDRLIALAKRRGVEPIRETKVGGTMPFPVQAVLVSDIDWYNLIADDTYVQDVRYAAERGKSNPTFTSAIDLYRGCLLYVVERPDPGDYFLGSFLRPEAKTSSAMTAGQTTLTVGPTTAVTGVDYARYFPRNAASHTLMIKSTTGTEKVTYTGAAGEPAVTGWATIARAAGGTTALAHAANALVTLNDNGRVLLLGKYALMRAWGKNPEPIKQTYDYEHEIGVGIKWFYGLESVQNADNQCANAVALEVT
jgi:N4-gp56 family major capsid protein